jgi:flagellar basal-body rod protein FlgC
MGMFDSMNIAATGLSAQRLRMDVLANNIANAETTRTPEGGPYKRQTVVLRPVNERPTFESYLLPKTLEHGAGKGVKVVRIAEDSAEPRLIHDPSHPDAFKSGPMAGYVAMPNVNPVVEFVNLMAAQRAYEANITVIQGHKRAFERALMIGLR